MGYVLAALIGFCIGKSEYIRECAKEFKRGWDDAGRKGK